MKPTELIKNQAEVQPPTREFSIGARVWARNYRDGLWYRGTVVEREGNVLYGVEVDGVRWRKHVDQLRADIEDNDVDDVPSGRIVVPPSRPEEDTPVEEATPATPQLRRSTRANFGQPPDRYGVGVPV